MDFVRDERRSLPQPEDRCAECGKCPTCAEILREPKLTPGCKLEGKR